MNPIKYGTDDDPYSYKGTDVLINKLDIKSNVILEKAEEEISTLAANSIDFSDPPYDSNYWKSIHNVLFTDLYSWAGEFRTVNITKGSTIFCNPLYIDNELNRLFNNFNNIKSFTELSYSDVIQHVSEFYIELNLIHPFREGNGRSQRILFDHILANCGYSLEWNKITKDIWLQANINGVELNYKPMEDIISKSLQEF